MTKARETSDVLSSRGTAATADVQTSPSDATAGALLNNETTHIGGEINYTGANYQPETSQNPLGVVKLMNNNSGGTIANDSIVSGASLRQVYVNTSGVVLGTSTADGSWKQVSGFSSAMGECSAFVKVSN